MWAVFKKEIRTFFTSSVGYLVLGLFFLLNGLFLWVFKGPFNIFDQGFADLGNFFLLVPWVFLFLIPAITMKSFSEERKLGTLELLLIKPFSPWHLVLGKFLGNFALVLFAMLPTLVYVYTVSVLGRTPGNLDMGIVYGSYLGILMLAMVYSSMGLFASAMTNNQIVAFLLALVICFTTYYGFEAFATLFSNGTNKLFVQGLGMKHHVATIAKGILDTRNIIYFLSLVALFLALTVQKLNKVGN